MAYPNKRHYRVAQRDKEMLDESTAYLTENIQKITLLGLMMYLCTTLLSFSLGYFIGKNQ